jgi:hypothetical protein
VGNKRHRFYVPAFPAQPPTYGYREAISAAWWYHDRYRAVKQGEAEKEKLP